MRGRGLPCPLQLVDCSQRRWEETLGGEELLYSLLVVY